jgi:hypothetical protein
MNTDGHCTRKGCLSAFICGFYTVFSPAGKIAVFRQIFGASGVMTVENFGG